MRNPTCQRQRLACCPLGHDGAQGDLLHRLGSRPSFLRPPRNSTTTGRCSGPRLPSPVAVVATGVTRASRSRKRRRAAPDQPPAVTFTGDAGGRNEAPPLSTCCAAHIPASPRCSPKCAPGHRFGHICCRSHADALSAPHRTAPHRGRPKLESETYSTWLYLRL